MTPAASDCEYAYTPMALARQDASNIADTCSAQSAADAAECKIEFSK